MLVEAPSTTRADPGTRRVLLTRALRGFADGLVSVLLAGHLARLGFSSFQIGAIVAGTLLGSAVLTMAVGLGAHRLDPRRVLVGSSLLMIATGVGFGLLGNFWALLALAVVGTLNPSGSDVSLFLPTEQTLLAHAVAAERPALFARYNVAGTLASAFGALASVAPALMAARLGIDLERAERLGFFLYGAIGLASAAIYAGLPPTARHEAPVARRPLAHSRRIVFHLAALFSLDSFGGGFVVQALLVLWLARRFALPAETMGAVFFAAGLLGAISQLASPWLATRIGLVRTMVYTHLPANLFLLLAGVVSSAPAAVGLLLARALLSQMDVPVRQAYVMGVVPPEERAAAAGVTNVPRSLAAALPPFLAGAMLDWSTFGWPLIVAGALKGLYDLLLLAQFRAVPPLEHS
jgi:MFS family permease